MPSAFKFLLNEFTSSFQDLKTFEGYRLLAADDCDLNIWHNPNDADTYFQSTPDVEALIRKNILPIREGRKDPRKVKAKAVVSFLYRVA